MHLFFRVYFLKQKYTAILTFPPHASIRVREINGRIEFLCTWCWQVMQYLLRWTILSLCCAVIIRFSNAWNEVFLVNDLFLSCVTMHALYNVKSLFCFLPLRSGHCLWCYFVSSHWGQDIVCSVSVLVSLCLSDIDLFHVVTFVHWNAILIYLHFECVCLLYFHKL